VCVCERERERKRERERIREREREVVEGGIVFNCCNSIDFIFDMLILPLVRLFIIFCFLCELR
jgi:hypothetical protein